MPMPSFTAKEISSSHGDRLIRVLTPTPKGNDFHASTFSESEVQSVDDMGQDRSALVLRSGVQIPVALPYDELEQNIYSPSFRTDGPVLDLRNVTGPPANGGSANKEAKPKAPANDTAEPKIGDRIPDGTVFAGISPDTNKPMYATPADASLTMKFNEAQEYAAKLDAHGHKDWRVPTKAELNVLFNNRAAIGGFDISGSLPTGWYWSSSQFNRWDAWGQNFVNATKDNYPKYHLLSVRLVRSPPSGGSHA